MSQRRSEDERSHIRVSNAQMPPWFSDITTFMTPPTQIVLYGLCGCGSGVGHGVLNAHICISCLIFHGFLVCSQREKALVCAYGIVALGLIWSDDDDSKADSHVAHRFSNIVISRQNFHGAQLGGPLCEKQAISVLTSASKP